MMHFNWQSAPVSAGARFPILRSTSVIHSCYSELQTGNRIVAFAQPWKREGKRWSLCKIPVHWIVKCHLWMHLDSTTNCSLFEALDSEGDSGAN